MLDPETQGDTSIMTIVRANVPHLLHARTHAIDVILALSTQVGTPAFCAPEISMNAPYNTKADIFSYGLTILELYSPVSSKESRIENMALK